MDQSISPNEAFKAYLNYLKDMGVEYVPVSMESFLWIKGRRSLAKPKNLPETVSKPVPPKKSETQTKSILERAWSRRKEDKPKFK